MGLVRLGLVVVTLTTAFTAAAQDKEAARKAYSEGARYYNLNQFAEALEAFKRAYWNYEEPSFLYNIAQCHRALKHKAEAIDFYRSYLRTAPAAPNRAEVERIVAELESALAQERAVAKAPPEGTLAAPPPTANPPAPSAAVSTTAPPAKSDRPLWKRGWVWGVVAGAAVVVAGVAIGVGVATSTSPKDPSPSLGRATFN